VPADGRMDRHDKYTNGCLQSGETASKMKAFRTSNVSESAERSLLKFGIVGLL